MPDNSFNVKKSPINSIQCQVQKFLDIGINNNFFTNLLIFMHEAIPFPIPAKQQAN